MISLAMAAEAMDPALAAQIAAAVAAAVAAQPKPATDWTGIAAVLGPVGVILGLIINAWLSWSAKRDAAKAVQIGVETKGQLVEQTKNLDGKLKELTDSLVDAAEKKGTLIEKEAQAGRDAAVDAAALRAIPATAPTVGVGLGGGEGKAVKVEVTKGPDIGQDAIRTRTDPAEAKEAAEAAHIAHANDKEKP